jgi:hypothetical protein
MDRLLGNTIPPPPANVPAIEPDISGATTIREQLDLHRNHAACAGCHAKMDPPGFALESFDVIGRQRNRYRTVGEGDKPERGTIDPFISLSFLLGPVVDASGVLPDGREFAGINHFQFLASKDGDGLTLNLLRQLQTYAIGRAPMFADRKVHEGILNRVKSKGGGLRSLIHELVASEIFVGK